MQFLTPPPPRGRSNEYWPDDGRLNCAWQPEMPPRKLEGEMLEGYEQALGVFMQLVADTLDRPIVLYDHDIVRMVAPAGDYEVMH